MYGLRPLRLGELFDAAIKITKRHPARTFGGAGIVFGALAIVQWIDLVTVDLSDGTTPSLVGLLFAGTGRESVLFRMALVGGLIALKPFVFDTVHHELIGTPLGSWQRLIRMVPSLAASGAVYLLATAAGLGLLVVPGVLVALLGSVSQPAIVNEGQGPIAALRRSYHLVRRDLGRVAGFTLVLWTARILAGLAIALALPGVLPYSLQPSSTRLLAISLTVAIATAVWPVSLAARAVLFTDLRVRAESLDVDLLIARTITTPDRRDRWAPVA